MKQIFTSIDIGTDSVKIICVELINGRLHLLASTSKQMDGMKKGLIINQTLALNTLKEAIDDIESKLNLKIKKVITTIPSYFSEFDLIKGEIELPIKDSNDEYHHINGNDILSLFKIAMKDKMNLSNEMVTVLPIDFDIDGKKVKDPKGYTANKLKTRSVLVSVPRQNIYSVYKLLDELGIEIIDFNIGSIADYHAFKNKDFDNKTIIVVNIGHEITTISLFKRNIIVSDRIVQMGGANIDSDIAYMYKLDKFEASKLKKNFALASRIRSQINDTYTVNNILDDEIKINQCEVSEVVAARIDELLELIKEEIENMTPGVIDNIIFTGGSSNLRDLAYNLDEKFGKCAIIGNVVTIGIRNNKYSTCLGNVLYYINKGNIKGSIETMFTKSEQDSLSNVKKNFLNINNDNMLGKFLNFFGE